MTKGNGFGKKHQSAPLMQIIVPVMGSVTDSYSIAPRVAASAAALVESGGGNFSPAFDQVFRGSELPAAEEVDEEADERQEECT